MKIEIQKIHTPNRLSREEIFRVCKEENWDGFVDLTLVPYIVSFEEKTIHAVHAFNLIERTTGDCGVTRFCNFVIQEM